MFGFGSGGYLFSPKRVECRAPTGTSRSLSIAARKDGGTRSWISTQADSSAVLLTEPLTRRSVESAGRSTRQRWRASRGPCRGLPVERSAPETACVVREGFEAEVLADPLCVL